MMCRRLLLPHVCRWWAGYALGGHVQRLGIGGSDLNQWMGHLLARAGYKPSVLGPSVLQKLKEARCQVALDFARAQSSAKEQPAASRHVPPGRAPPAHAVLLVTPCIVCVWSCSGGLADAPLTANSAFAGY